MMTRDEAARIQAPHTPRYTKERNHDFCCASVSDGPGTFFSRQCSRAIKVRYGDLGYCGTHDPAKVKARRDERSVKWQRDWRETKLKQEARKSAGRFLTRAKRLCVRSQMVTMTR